MNGLEGRSRLVVHGHRAVAARPGGRSARVVGVHARPVGQREHRAGARIEHQRGGAPWPPGGPHLAEHLLGALLDCRVDRQPEVLAGRGALGLDHAHGLAQRVLHEPRGSRPSRAGPRRASTRAPRARRCPCPPCPAPVRRASPAGSSASAPSRCRCPRSSAAGPCDRPTRPSSGAGRRSPRRPRSFAAARPPACRAAAPAGPATLAGLSIRKGLAKTVIASSDTASSSPLRSKIVPRLALTVRSSSCWVAARSLSEPARTVPIQIARTAAIARRARKTAKSSPILRSTRRTPSPTAPSWTRRARWWRWARPRSCPHPRSRLRGSRRWWWWRPAARWWTPWWA